MKTFSYPVVIKAEHLDAFNHMNNATYLQLYEEARWDILNTAGYDLAHIKKVGLAPTILKVTVSFLKEIHEGDEIIIQSHALGYKNKVGQLSQTMLRNDDICSEAVFTMGLFSLEARKLVYPTEEWLAVLGL